MYLPDRGGGIQVVRWPERPAPRAHHSMNYLRGMLFVFGGIGEADTVLSDLHFYDTVARRWSGEVAREWCCDERSVRGRGLFNFYFGRFSKDSNNNS